ncbi:MAG TPA: hypothetical protein DCQ64_01240 [Candidatus Rokubacteria bacterium]|nr:hypothetical protein [Candidatus Rokubacteria bacterium]
MGGADRMMPDAGPMIDRCFRAQHPEAYGRDGILPEFPWESRVTTETIPDGANREGDVSPKLVERVDSAGL